MSFLIDLDKADLQYLYTRISEIVEAKKDCKSAVAATRPILAELLTSNLIDNRFVQPIPERPAAYLVHRPIDRSYSVISMVWSGGQMFPIHDHQSWGLIGVYSNSISEQRFGRLDDGSKPGYAEIIETKTSNYSEGEILEEGLEYDALHKNDIHRILNPTTAPSVSIHIVAADLGMKHRNQYDPEAKTVRKFISGYDDPEHRREGRIIGGKNPNEVLSVEPHVVVDLRGLRCPLPAKRVADEIEHAEAGKLLELLTDSEGSAYDEIPAELDVLASSFVVLEQWQGLWKVKVRK